MGVMQYGVLHGNCAAQSLPAQYYSVLQWEHVHYVLVVPHYSLATTAVVSITVVDFALCTSGYPINQKQILFISSCHFSTNCQTTKKASTASTHKYDDHTYNSMIRKRNDAQWREESEKQFCGCCTKNGCHARWGVCMLPVHLPRTVLWQRAGIGIDQ